MFSSLKQGNAGIDNRADALASEPRQYLRSTRGTRNTTFHALKAMGSVLGSIPLMMGDWG